MAGACGEAKQSKSSLTLSQEITKHCFVLTQDKSCARVVTKRGALFIRMGLEVNLFDAPVGWAFCPAR